MKKANWCPTSLNPVLLSSWTVVCLSFTLLMMLLLPGWPTMGLNRIRKKKNVKSKHEQYVMKNALACNSSSVKFSPSSFATRLRFLNEILPVSSSSNSRNAFKISSFESFSLILTVIIARKSLKSTVPAGNINVTVMLLMSSHIKSNQTEII